MFDIGWQEIFVVAIFALIVVGPKDLPKAIRAITYWIRKAKMMTREFQAGVNEMVREAELENIKDTLTDPMDLKKTFTDAVDPDGSLAKDMTLSEADLTSSLEDKITIDEALETGIIKPPALNNVPAGKPAPAKKKAVKRKRPNKKAVKRATKPAPKTDPKA